ncbi:MAG: hypothetical protein KAJ19_16190 [Gammaproteobacteria bacterium]|nr:hypothetical protein [Gammaproteobacteria bacterium]
MTISLSDVAIEQFPDMFTNVYQAMDKMLPPTVQNQRGVVGDAWHASVVGQFSLDDRGAYQSDIPPSDVSHTDVVGTFLNKIKNLPTDAFQQGEVKANERQNLARLSAYAVARQEDQIIIDQMATDPLVTKTVADGGVNLTVEKIREAAELLDEDEVPFDNRTFIAHVSQKRSLLSQTETTSSDFMTVKTLVEGQIDTFYGFKFLWFGNREEGGIPLAGNIRTCFAYHFDSLMASYGDIMNFNNPDIEVVWDHRSQSHLVIPKLRMGAKVILGEGIVKVNCDES